MKIISSRFPVFLKSENPAFDAPRHSASKSLTLLALSTYAARWVSEEQKAIQLTCVETWRECKDRVRPTIVKRIVIPKLHAASMPLNLDLSYPARGQETVTHPHAAFVAACNQARQRNA